MKFKWNKSKWYFLGLIFIGVISFHFYIPRFITEINNPIVQLFTHSEKKQNVFDSDKQLGESIEAISFDGHLLKGYLTYSKIKPAKGTVLLLHGIRSKKEYFMTRSNWLAQNGFNAVAIDSRAHGESSGQYCTFGVKEKKDVKSWVDLLIAKKEISLNIGLWGQSLGGAIGLQALAYDNRLKFGIIESTFSDFKTIATHYFEYHLGFELKWATNYLIERSGEISDFDITDAQPYKYCSEIHQPIILVHGNRDKRINIKYGKANFEQIRSLNKEFIEINNAGHLDISEIGGLSYKRKVKNFLNSIKSN